MIKEIKQFNLNFGTFQIKPPFIWHIWHIFKIWNKPSSMFQRRLLPTFFFTKFKTIPIQISFISFWKLHELSFQATINRIEFFTIYFIQKGYTEHIFWDHAPLFYWNQGEVWIFVPGMPWIWHTLESFFKLQLSWVSLNNKWINFGKAI